MGISTIPTWSRREVFHDAHETYLILELYGGELFDRIVKKQYYTESEATTR